MYLNDSKTKENLMKAFAGESQARNRYNIAAKIAEKQGLYILKDLFDYTANQEKEHAELFFKALKECNCDNFNISGGYPISYYDNVVQLLRAAEHGEFEEHDNVYPEFAKVAQEEGFTQISQLFTNIAKVEKAHGDRFKRYADMLESNTLFDRTESTSWMCTNCGFIYEGKSAPQVCPVCSVPQGYYIELKNSPYE